LGEKQRIKIRIASPEDRESIEKLTRILVKDRQEEFDMKRFEWGLLRRLYDPLQRNGIFVAEHIDGNQDDPTSRNMAGMIFTELRVDPFGYSEGYIKQFYVCTECRGKGIGKTLLDAVILHLKKMDVQKMKINIDHGKEDMFRQTSKLDFQNKFSVLELTINDTNNSHPEAEVINFEID
jgi:ribosomal protein S18 acetylase RimI-like enzyme